MNNIEELNINKWHKFDPINLSHYSESQQIAAERLFGSYPFSYIKSLEKSIKQEQISNVLAQRAKNIMCLIENGHIKENDEAEYTKSLLKYVVEVYE